jgi:hypothetical protein
MESAETEHSLGARDAVAIFMSYPECAWDVTHQTVVLYWPLNDRNVDGPLSLVVTFDDGEDGYFAGQLEAKEIFSAIHVPSSGAFRLQVYLAAELAPGVDRVVPLRSFRFDPTLAVHPDAILHRDQKLRTRLFRLDERTGFTRMSRVREVLPGTSLKRFLDEQGGIPPGWAGLAVTHLQAGNRPTDIIQGPSAQPFRKQGHFIGVDFLRRADKRWPIPGGIVIPGFEHLTYPVIRLDLTDFGEGARRAADGVTFFRRSLGSTGFKQTPGAGLKIHRSEERIYLIWECTKGCHRDLIGVHFRGGPQLVASSPSGTDDPRIPFTGSTEPATCIAGLYLGSEVWERPEQAVEFVPEDLGAPFELDLDRLQIERFFAWANEDARVRAANADLRGASCAESCTLYAYIQFLGRVVQQSGGMDVIGLFKRLGLRLDSFGDFARRPDLAFAAIGNEALQQRLLAAGERLVAPGLEGDLSPLAFFATALEPEDGELATWADSLSVQEQSLLWSLLVGGASLSALRQSGHW